ncbi:amidohydrolase family protein [Archangium violaceum]|uniref:amidohydrolase family protein n=1 Tax=Archangium violaceum TaxID=83451 RepID=UPI0009FFE7D2|nr:amidohydrolase family protein [Archangium violaceum]
MGPTVKPPDHPDYAPLYQRAEQQTHIEHFKKFYRDTASLGFEPSTIQLACDFFGVERVLFGSDSPMDSRSGELFTPETDRTVAALKLTEAERRDIYGGNMTRLLSRERVKTRRSATP